MKLHARIRSFGSMVIVGLAAVAAALRATPGGAQGVTAGDAVTGPSGHAPFVTQQTPAELTPEERRRREEALSRSNPPGPPLPVEPEFQRRSPALPPTEAPRVTPKRPNR